MSIVGGQMGFTEGETQSGMTMGKTRKVCDQIHGCADVQSENLWKQANTHVVLSIGRAGAKCPMDESVTLIPQFLSTIRLHYKGQHVLFDVCEMFLL